MARDLEMVPSALYRYFDGRDVGYLAQMFGALGFPPDEAVRRRTPAYSTR